MEEEKTEPRKGRPPVLAVAGAVVALIVGAIVWLSLPSRSITVAVAAVKYKSANAVDVRSGVEVFKSTPGEKRYYFPLSVKWRDMKGLRALRKRWYAEAVHLLTASLNVMPDNPRALADRGAAYLCMGELDKGRADLEAAAALEPGLDKVLKRSLSRAHFSRGRRLVEEKRLPEALKDLNSALSLDPENASIHAELASVSISGRKFKECLTHLNRAIELDPELQEAYGNRGACLSALGKYEAALKDLDKAVALDPSRPETYGTRAGVHIWLKNYEAALKDAQKAVSLDPELKKTMAPVIAYVEKARKGS